MPELDSSSKGRLNSSLQQLESRVRSIREAIEVGASHEANKWIDMAIRELQLIDALIDKLYPDEEYTSVQNRNPFENNYLMTPTFTG